jgi:Glycosyltransferases involved in cell wall biogenesis
MQSKVSMVMPCYNKVKYIGEMFDSILAQEWDNIELILVNDGSTDGTREVITEYEPKFRNRGFEVIVEDQKNAGVCAAAKAGLALATGDYICMVDSDDELDPKYVSVMAGWLDENTEYDYCICNAVRYTGNGENKAFEPVYLSKIKSKDPFYTERYLLGDIRMTVWVYLVRAEYFKKCNIIQSYFTETNGSHEPGYIIPLTMHNGNYKYFDLPLYHFNVADLGHSRHDKYEQQKKFYDEYYQLCEIAINLLPEEIADSKKKEHLIKTALISRSNHLYRYAKKISDGYQYIDQALEQLVETMNSIYEFTTPITKYDVIGKEEFFVLSIKNILLGIPPTKISIKPNCRIIGYGALGKSAAALIPLLKNTPIEPMELWDISGDGEAVKKPDFSSLKKDDLMLVFPLADQVLSDVKECSPCFVLNNNDIKHYLSHYLIAKYLT